MKKLEAIKQMELLKKSFEFESEKLLEIIKSCDNPKTVFERIKTVDDVCVEYGTSLEQFNNKWSCLEENERAFKIIKMATKIFNEGWVPNYNDSTQKKWYNWFEFRAGSGFCFSNTNYSYAYANATVGSRICFKDEKTAEHVGRLFVEIYEKFMM